MKTDQLIEALAADRARSSVSMMPRMLLAFGAGFVVAGAIFTAFLGVRTDIATALQTWRFDVKLAVLAAAVVAGLVMVQRSASPAARFPSAPLMIVAALLGAAVIAELFSAEPRTWAARLGGTNALVCLTMVPLLAAAPLVLLIASMRLGAPRSPALAGAGIGFAAFAIGAVLYGLHCFDDSPLFVATWYSLAAVPIVATGALLGKRYLRW